MHLRNKNGTMFKVRILLFNVKSIELFQERFTPASVEFEVGLEFNSTKMQDILLDQWGK